MCLRFERISLPAHRDDITGGLWILFELLPQPGNVNVYRARPDEGLIVPDAGQQALSGENLSAMIDQLPEQLQFFRRKADGRAAAQHFPAFRLPELFCGFDRASTGAPIAYPVACSPQAWAAGAALMLIRTMLGLQADAPNRRLTLDRPILPAGLTKVVIRGLRVGDASCDLLLHRWRGLTSAEVLRKDAQLEVVVRL